MNKKKRIKYISALLMYIILIVLANWSLLSGTNLMKWDIWDAQFPNQMITTDAIRSGQFPIWNPLFNYGTPNYAQVGTPVWYIVTIILDLIGYGPTFPGIEYSLHLVIAAMGMFSLTYDSIINNKNLTQYTKYMVAFASGALYAFSGVFLSNAQHIMIIISAAWIPFVLLFTKKIVTLPYNKLLYTMLSGILASFVLLGGYPEQFFDMFIVVFVWMFVLNILGGGSFFAKIKKAILHYIGFAICTALSAAITLIPFLHLKNQITRGGGQVLMSYSFESLLSAFLPVSFDKIAGKEISMGLFYVGIITVISLPLVFKLKKKNYLYLGAALMALFLSFGASSFLYEIFYRFLPMYSTFRFPTVWRSYWALFSILAVADAWAEILEGSHNIFTLEKTSKYICCITFLFSVVICLGKFFFVSEMAVVNMDIIGNAMFMLTGITFAYYCMCKCISHNVFPKTICSTLFVAVICIELLAVAQKSMPFTIARRDSLAYFQDNEYAVEVSNEKETYNKRNRTSDFSNSLRSASGLGSNHIAINKLLDEEGYVSIKLSSIEKYKESCNRIITGQNPVMYFTNDIVTSAEISLDNWLQLTDVSPYQIYVDSEERTQNYENIVKAPNNDVISENNNEFQYVEKDNKYIIKGEYITKNDTVTRIRLFTQEKVDDIKISAVCVKAADDSSDKFSGCYETNIDAQGMRYIDLPLPKTKELYSEINFTSDRLIDKVSVVELARNAVDTNLKIKEFGYNNVSASVEAPSDGVAVLMQSYYDGWKAWVDGKRVDIEVVDGCFIGIPVEEGSHKIELRFEPWDFKLGAGISLIYMGTFSAVIIYANKKNKIRL